jgi:hypothetical protein
MYKVPTKADDIPNHSVCGACIEDSCFYGTPPHPHLRTERNLVPEILCLILFRLSDDGLSPDTR